MSNMSQGQIHYRCAIDLETQHPNRDDWKDLVKRVRTWVAKVAKVDETELAKPWFYTGDRWKQGCPTGFSLETGKASIDGSTAPPTYWGCRIEHQCGEHRVCRWGTDITITTVDPKRFRLVLVNRRWVRPEYIGTEPSSPAPSVPSLVQILLRAKSWRCTAGTEHLSAAPVIARVGYLDLLKKQLEDSGRACPLVYISLERERSAPMINAYDLARALAGTAVVYVAENSEADKEIEALFEKDFQCRNGMIRVYQPSVSFSHPPDARRHRFFTGKVIEELGSQEVQLQIVRACCRRAYLVRPGDVTSIEEIQAQVRLARLRSVANQCQEKDSDFLELVESVQADNVKYVKDIEDLRQELEFKSMEIEERDEELRSVNYQFDAYKQASQAAYMQISCLETRLQTIQELEVLPQDLREALALVAKLHTGRIVVLEDAFKSASKAELEQSSLGTAWSCLWALSTYLHDLYFLQNQPTDIEVAFKTKTGFDLALNEGRQTNRDAKFARLRQRTYDGKLIDITQHVKWGNRMPRCLRIHYHVDRERKCLVIGHCGDHLDNFSTRSAG